MPTCMTCGVHYKLSKDYSDAFECPDCVDVITENTSNFLDENSLEYDLYREGCSRTLPKFYED